MTSIVRMQAHILRRLGTWPGLGLSVLLTVLSPQAIAAPAEGTAGQTITGRAFKGADGIQKSSGGRTAVTSKSAKPAWKDLSALQQMSLQPLASRWDRMSGNRKQKWLLISKNYPNLPPQEQAKLHLRMSKWVSLSQSQRTQARMSFKGTKTLSPEQKAAQWAAYQALSPEEKRKLAAKARSKPAGVATVKPASSPKLTRISRHPHGKAQGARLAGASLPTQKTTLLPLSPPPDVESEKTFAEDEETEE